MSGPALFDLNEPKDLYRIIHETYADYIERPTERDFLLLVFGFTHLREWIAESNHIDIQKKTKSGAKLSEAEEFFNQIHDIPEFKTVQKLCNRGKHFISKGQAATTSKTEGLRVGLAKVGDRLDQTYYLVDNKDSRDLFIPLIRKYNEWFAR